MNITSAPDIPDMPLVAERTQVTILPVIYGNNKVSRDDLLDALSHDKGMEVFHLMRNHPEQRRKNMQWDERLADIAHMRLYSQARDGWTGHVSPDGTGANEWVRSCGYKVPGWYPGGKANNIESLGRGGDGSLLRPHPVGMWHTWMSSEGHRMHILGLHPFYEEQTQIGAAYCKMDGSESLHYWAILTVPRTGES